MFVLMSTFVAFGSWPGAQSHTNVDQVLLREVAKPRAKTVAVRSDAVVVARRAARREERRRARVVARTPAGTPVAKLPTGTAAPRTPGSQPAASATPSPSSPGGQVQQPAKDVTQNVDTTTRDVTTQVQQQVTDVKTQVDEVIGGAIGGPQTDGTGPVENVTNGVKDALGSPLGG
jgi:hypothetical protein